MSDCQSGLKPLLTLIFFSNIYHSLYKYHRKWVFKENSTFGVNFSAAYFADHIIFLQVTKSERQNKRNTYRRVQKLKMKAKIQINIVTE